MAKRSFLTVQYICLILSRQTNCRDSALLTSKEVLEKTGISRATLNNYISWGIVARPDVLPPEPDDGAAPRIGYFPDGVVQRIEQIQRLKREGWSITRIAAHFMGDRPAASAVVEPAVAPPPPAPLSAGVRRAMPTLSIDAPEQPAYLVNDSFEVLWLNDAAGSAGGPHPPLPPDAVSHGLFAYLLRDAAIDAERGKAILRFHLAVAKRRGAGLTELCRDVPPEQIALLQRLYDEAERIDPGLVVQTRLSPGGAGWAPAVSLYAVDFREGTLFLYAPAPQAAEESVPQRRYREGVIADVARTRSPALTEVAVLVTDLQNSAVLWSELPAEEYFELINQIWLTVDPIFRRCRGTHGKHPGEGMVCYFFPQPDSSYLWNAVLAAHHMREAIRAVSREWQLRKGWTTELAMNTGIDEGLEWLGAFKSGAEVELIVLGDTVNHAAGMSALSRAGAIWVTRKLVSKLSPDERQRLKFGVRRTRHDGKEVFVHSSFSRVEHLADRMGAAEGHTPRDIARLPIAEILDIALEPGGADRTGRNPT